MGIVDCKYIDFVKLCREHVARTAGVTGIIRIVRILYKDNGNHMCADTFCVGDIYSD